MRARQRHFNPAGVGAYSALDARFGFSLADNTAIDTWDDRTSGNKDATGTGTARPLYRTGVMGGNPVVRFDGSNDYLKISTVTASKVTLLSALSSTQTGNTQICLQWGTNTTATDNQFHLWITSSKYACFYRDNTATDRGITATSNKTSNPTIIATLFDSTQRFWENGVAGGTAATSGTLNQSTAAIGLGVKLKPDGTPPGVAEVNYFNGDMGAMIIVPSALGDPARRRIESYLAYSFKIACS